MDGGRIGKSMCAMGGCSKLTSAYGRRGSKFSYFHASVLNNPFGSAMSKYLGSHSKQRLLLDPNIFLSYLNSMKGISIQSLYQ